MPCFVGPSPSFAFPQKLALLFPVVTEASFGFRIAGRLAVTINVSGIVFKFPELYFVNVLNKN